MNSCPLCHDELAVGTEIALVPVSPVVYPGIEGLQVHANCLAAARRGEFDEGRASVRHAIESLRASVRDRVDTRFENRGTTEGRE